MGVNLKIKETKEKIIESLNGLKEYNVIYKFSDVIEIIKAKDDGEAQNIADDRLYSKNNPMTETYCYEVEIEEEE